MAEEKTNGSGQAAVYVSWTTFKNTIETLIEGVPNQIDRSVFPGMAWAVQNQLWPALKFLGLIDEKSKPTPTLHALAVEDEEVRKKKLQAILRERYGSLFALDLTKTTLAELSEKLGAAYNATGETREKAVRFFISAANYAGVPLSPFLAPKSANGSAPLRKRRRPAKTPAAAASVGENETRSGHSTEGTSRAITLRSGGTLTLSASLDLFALVPEDRAFVFGLIDKLDEYEHGNTEANES